jgi:hypothetical protein
MTMACERFAAGDKVGSSSTQFSFYFYFLFFYLLSAVLNYFVPRNLTLHNYVCSDGQRQQSQIYNKYG